MNRRSFLNRSSLLSLATLLVPSPFLACRKNTQFANSRYPGKVIIIGAGAAGLYAGLLLQSRGIRFSILEAAPVYGGRLGKLTGFADYSIDTGAQWMHGNNSIVADLAAASGAKISPDNPQLTYWFNAQLVNSLPKDPFIFEDDDLPDQSFADYARQKGFGPEYDYIIEAIAGDQGAAASLISAYWNSKDEENWSSGSHDFKFTDTYFDLIDMQIAKPVLQNIILNTPVASIDYGSSEIRIRDTSNTFFTADKVIVTVPISILKRNDIEFIPNLPDEKIQAFAKFGMGPGMKVFLKFKTRFYRNFLYGGKVCAAYIDDTAGKRSSEHVLLAFVMGKQAADLHALGNDNAITRALLNELDTIYNTQATPAFIQSSVHDFTARPFIHGAYGYSTIGMGNARQIAAKQIDNKVFFAGEAMNLNGHHQTVQGALESAYKAVNDILSGLDQ